MTRAEKIAEAQRLRAEGLKLREIAERLGAHFKTVAGWLNDPDREKVLARRARYAGRCEVCGCPTDGSNGPAKAPKLCREHSANRFAERNARIFEAWEGGETAPIIGAREGMTASAVAAIVDHHRRRNGAALSLHRRRNRELWALIEKRWNEDVPAVGIASECGTTSYNILAMVQAMRRAGLDLAYRPGGGFEIDADVRARAVALYREGLSCVEAAEATGVSRESVRRWAQQAGVEIRPRGRRRNQLKAAA